MTAKTANDEKTLALQYALTALIKTLLEANVIERGDLFRNLTDCRTRLENLGENGAAAQLTALSESLIRT